MAQTITAVQPQTVSTVQPHGKVRKAKLVRKPKTSLKPQAVAKPVDKVELSPAAQTLANEPAAAKTK